MKVVSEFVLHEESHEARGLLRIVRAEDGKLFFEDEDTQEWFCHAPKKVKLEVADEFRWGDLHPDNHKYARLIAMQEHPGEWVKHYDAKPAGMATVIKLPEDHPDHVIIEDEQLNAWTVGRPTTFELELGDTVKFTARLAASTRLEFVGAKGDLTMADPNAILTALAKALGTEAPGPKDVDIERTGAKIILPPGMSFKSARDWLTKKEEEENTKVAINEEVDAFPLDGAQAFMRALKDIYGWTESLPTPGFFGTTPPTYVAIDKGPFEKVQIIWGRVAVPAIAGHFDTGFAVKDNKVIFRITGETKQKHMDDVKRIALLTRQYAREFSLYRGQAIRVTFPNINDEKFNPLTHAPRFIDTSKVKESDLIFPQDVMQLIETTLFTPIRATEACREAKIPLKRGILFEGQFGTGKTLTAYITALLCVRHGWTFIYVEDVRRLDEAMRFAKQYTPSVVFAEDIDRVDRNDDGEYTDRGELMNGILNTIDGVDMKGLEIMVVVTTNHVEHITQAMLRPGRLDAVIPVRTPDAWASERLVRLFAGHMLDLTADLSRVGVKLSGNIPAVIREVVERSKLAAISRLTLAKQVVDVARLEITAGDLEVATDGMIAHLELLKVTPPDTRSDIEKAASVVADALKWPAGSTRQAIEGDLPIPTEPAVGEPV